MTQNEIYKQITKRVCALFDVTEEQLKSKSRKHEITQARHVWNYLIKKILGWSCESIGDLSSRHRATIMNSMKVVNDSFDMKGIGGLTGNDLSNCNTIMNEFKKEVWNVKYS